MPNLKSALDIENLKKELQEDLNSSPAYIEGIAGKGIANSRTTEPIPQFAQSRAEKVFESGTNAYIIAGKDRPGSVFSGYGGRGDSGTGTLDLIAGRMSHEPASVGSDNKELRVNPDFKLDASRIYISQKTDLDDNFDLVDGRVGRSKARAGIAMKSDAIRMIGREGIKLVTGTDVKNSTGEDLVSVSGIDLIAGNDDSNLQPLVLGKNANESLNKLTNYVSKLSGILQDVITYQMKYNMKIQLHTHITAFFGTPTAPSEVLLNSGIDVAVDMAKCTKNIIKFRTNLSFHKQTYYAVSGKKYINSSFNNVN